MKRVVLSTPAMRDEAHHKAETARQMARRAATLMKQSEYGGPDDDRLPVERRIIRRRALRLQRLIRQLAIEIETRLTEHRRAQFKRITSTAEPVPPVTLETLW
jgi:CRISPR/Cas system-associated endonuclease Cas1